MQTHHYATGRDITHAMRCAAQINAVRAARGLAPIDARVGNNGAIVSGAARPYADLSDKPPPARRVKLRGQSAQLLLALDAFDARAVRTLARQPSARRLSKAAISNVLSSLRKGGLVRSEHRAGDGYFWLLTPDGVAAQRRLRAR